MDRRSGSSFDRARLRIGRPVAKPVPSLSGIAGVPSADGGEPCVDAIW